MSARRKSCLSLISIFCIGVIFSLHGCALGTLHHSELRDLSEEVHAAVTIGAAREEVRSTLGIPLLEAKQGGVEVYRQAGADIGYVMAIWPVPWPFPANTVTGYILVAYDERGSVKDVAGDFWAPTGYPAKRDLWITAGGYHFINIWQNPPQTLLGPAISWDELARSTFPKSQCRLVLVMGECAMERISLDETQIADLSPAGDYCSHYADNNLHGWVPADKPQEIGACDEREVTSWTRCVNVTVPKAVR